MVFGVGVKGLGSIDLVRSATTQNLAEQTNDPISGSAESSTEIASLGHPARFGTFPLEIALAKSSMQFLPTVKHKIRDIRY
jgi:hypothetical protein